MKSISTKQTQVQVRVNDFIRSVYNWMAIGLALTGFVAFYVASTPALLNLIYRNQILFFGLIIAELALVFTISARIQRMQASTATALFVLYSTLNGATLSFIFIFLCTDLCLSMTNNFWPLTVQRPLRTLIPETLRFCSETVICIRSARSMSS